MEGYQGSRESDIINIAINIFQNVGIRRWIQEIEILKNQQIYFEICKIIFPQTIIHLFRLSENHSLTTGQKIQGVIDLIAKIIKNDLYHISGEAIANGKITHLKNFLQLLEALSNNMINTRDPIEVESAPENDQSFTYNEHNKSYYTVIGMEKQFGDMTIFDGQRQQSNHETNSGHTTTTVVDPLPPVPIPGPKQQLIPSDEINKLSRTPKMSPSHSKQNFSYPQPLRDKNSLQFQEENRRWLQTIKVMNLKKQSLEEDRLIEAKQAFIRWKTTHDFQQVRVKQQIKNEYQYRKKYINHKINQREIWLNSLKGEQHAAKDIKKLFQQQKNKRAQKKIEMKAKEVQSLKKLEDFNELNELHQAALRSNKPEFIFKGQ